MHDLENFIERFVAAVLDQPYTRTGDGAVMTYVAPNVAVNLAALDANAPLRRFLEKRRAERNTKE